MSDAALDKRAAFCAAGEYRVYCRSLQVDLAWVIDEKVECCFERGPDLKDSTDIR